MFSAAMNVEIITWRTLAGTHVDPHLSGRLLSLILYKKLKFLLEILIKFGSVKLLESQTVISRAVTCECEEDQRWSYVSSNVFQLQLPTDEETRDSTYVGLCMKYCH